MVFVLLRSSTLLWCESLDQRTNTRTAPRGITTLVRLFHDNLTGQVLCNGDCTNSINISNGVKQGCEFAPVLFNLFFLQILLHTVKDLDLDVYVKCRSDGRFCDLRRLSARTKIVEKLIIEALLADGCALVAHRENHLQTIDDRFAEAASLFGLTICHHGHTKTALGKRRS